MIKSQCKQCNKEIIRGGRKPGVFCSLDCKGEWQMEQKPVDYDWLYEKYLDEGLSTYQIAKLVNRNPKQVWNWLKGYGIPTRERDWDTFRRSDVFYQDKEWLEQEYLVKYRSAQDIADEFGVTANNVIYFLHKFDIPTRSMSETRAIQHWSSPGIFNGMYGKRGEEVPGWKGGITPERQLFYSLPEWKNIAKVVRERDGYKCRRCYKPMNGPAHHIHHIVSFAVEELRLDLDNLILLCNHCHRWVHSKANVTREYIKEYTRVGKGVL